MRRWLATLTVLCACSFPSEPAGSLERASASYKQHRDLASLETISRHLREGMGRTDVEALLGEADYSPIEGQLYYASDSEAPLEGTPLTATVGLVLEYRDDDGALTPRLQHFWVGPIGE